MTDILDLIDGALREADRGVAARRRRDVTATVDCDRHGMDIRNRTGYLIYQFDATHDGDRTRGDYLGLADDIIQLSTRGAAVEAESDYEDWTAERRLTLTPSTYALSVLDLTESSMIGEEDDPPITLHLTRGGAEWLRDALTAALAAE